MSGFIHSIALRITGQSAVDRATATVSRLDSAVDNVAGSADQASSRLANMGRTGQTAFSGLIASARNYIAVIGVGATMLGSLNAAAQMEGTQAAITFASGSAEQGAKNFEFLNQTVDYLGLNMQAATNGFRTLQGSVIGTSMEGQKSLELFYAMSEASTVLRMSGEQTEGAFLALGQMMSKGKVSAEELRGQLGERMPGAFGLAAKAMGVTTSELDKMLSNGELLAEDFLPAFANQLHKTFGGSAAEAAQGATANFNRFGAEVLRLKVAFGEQLLPVATQFVTEFLIPAIGWLKENISWLTTLGVTVAAGYAGFKAFTIGTALIKGGLAAAALMTKVMTGGMAALNGVMWANPIGIVIGALAALAAGIYFAWTRLEWFRAGMTGTWAAIKETGKIILEWLIAPYQLLAKLTAAVFSFDKNKIAAALKDVSSFMENSVKNAGDRVGAAFAGGFIEGSAAFKAAKKGKGTAGSMPDAVASSFADSGTPGGVRGGGSTADAGIKSGIKGISEGGRAQKNITINLGKFFEDIIIQPATVQQGAGEISDIVLRRLLQVLNTANQTQ